IDDLIKRKAIRPVGLFSDLSWTMQFAEKSIDLFNPQLFDCPRPDDLGQEICNINCTELRVLFQDPRMDELLDDLERQGNSFRIPSELRLIGVFEGCHWEVSVQSQLPTASGVIMDG